MGPHIGAQTVFNGSARTAVGVRNLVAKQAERGLTRVVFPVCLPVEMARLANGTSFALGKLFARPCS